ncbi:super-infection exclusion protein B [Segetibacter aerophilus]|uniref:super-infection exclusion protein B n=1 Tax=Segetibacter aerophilus TaxID=670293 RepID=UPI0011BF31BB|nr:super-infection exclusion protein B [Segetibacter aerophilus]
MDFGLVDKLFDIKKIPTRVVFLILVLATLLLFTPETFINRLSLSEFKKEYSKYIGIFFISSLAWIIITSVSWILTQISNILENKKLDREFKEVMKTLDNEERIILYAFSGQSTLQLVINSPVVAGLISKRILYKVGQFGSPTFHGEILWNCSLNQRACKYISRESLKF